MNEQHPEIKAERVEDSPAEVKMKEVLCGLVEKGKVLSFERTHKNSEDDARGIDSWLIFPDGERIPLQVTGSRERIRKKERKHPRIPVIYMAVQAEDGKYYDRRREKVEELVIGIEEKYKKESR